ncbi:hypothetical protein CVT24_009292 [Panaeolus cyanescens]|uniref:Uncharacterized protein n=1 Tax=Panaeolus cyanescens TaxID=181874 RepID=A0A409Y875_9AGAR|nr:hypothetical protein CVT24_009292 [Panaeolus cyanescens]
MNFMFLALYVALIIGFQAHAHALSFVLSKGLEERLRKDPDAHRMVLYHLGDLANQLSVQMDKMVEAIDTYSQNPQEKNTVAFMSLHSAIGPFLDQKAVHGVLFQNMKPNLVHVDVTEAMKLKFLMRCVFMAVNPKHATRFMLGKKGKNGYRVARPLFANQASEKPDSKKSEEVVKAGWTNGYTKLMQEPHAAALLHYNPEMYYVFGYSVTHGGAPPPRQ